MNSSSTEVSNHVLSILRKRFIVKNLGDIHFFIGIEIQRTSTGLFIHQGKYVIELLTKASVIGANSRRVPCLPSHKLNNYNGDPLSSKESTNYRSIVGGLQYLTWTKPGLSFAINQVCQYLHYPRTTHLQAIKRILHFVKGTISHGLLYTRSSSHITTFYDADWAGSLDDRRSTFGYCIFHGSNLIHWTTEKQQTVAHSSTEA